MSQIFKQKNHKITRCNYVKISLYFWTVKANPEFIKQKYI